MIYGTYFNQIHLHKAIYLVQNRMANVGFGVGVSGLIIAPYAVPDQVLQRVHRSKRLKTHVDNCYLTLADPRAGFPLESKSRI